MPEVVPYLWRKCRVPTLDSQPEDSTSRGLSRTSLRAAMFLLGLMLISACDNGNPSKPEEPQWASLGFEDHWAVELEVDWPYLYACAADEGLFRMDLSEDGSEWNYIGLVDTSLADTTFGHYTNRGVVEVIALGSGELMAGVIAGIGRVPRIFRSRDGGNTWAPSDTCGEGYPYYPCIWGGIYSLKCSPCDEEVILAGASGAVYRTEDGGSSWIHVGGIVDTGLGINDIQFHPLDCNVVWTVGQTSFFEPKLMKSIDHGNTWQIIDTRKLAQYGEGMYRLAFHPTDANVLYISMAGSVIKSADGGATWAATAFPRGYGHFYRGLVLDPRNPEHIFAAANLEVFESWDGGRTVERLETPEDVEIKGPVYSLKYHSPTATLYIGSLAGVYEYRK